MSAYWAVRRWLARPGAREAALAHTVAGLLDAVKYSVRHDDREESLRRLSYARKEFMKYLDAAYPQPPRPKPSPFVILKAAKTAD